MDYEIKSELTQDEKEECRELYYQQEFVSIEQNIDWKNVVGTGKKIEYFLMKENGKIASYAIIDLPQKKVAHIAFGTISRSKDTAVESIDVIIKHYKKKKYYYVKIQLPGPVNEESEFIEYRINRDHEIKYYFDRRNWSTSVINLNNDIETITKAFSTNHRRSLKKAKKFGVTARVLKTEKEIEKFNEIYVKMYKARGRTIEAESNEKLYKRMLKFFEDEKDGFFYGTFKDDELIGGIIMLIQGNAGFYHHAATDPDQRKIPMQHLGIVSVIEKLQGKGLNYFDFGGYNHMVTEGDQVFNINRFKDGFTKDYMFYPKLMFVEYVPMSIKGLEKFQQLKDIVKKVIRR